MTGPLSDGLPPVSDRWFEDYPPGASYEFGHTSMDEAAIVSSPAPTTLS